MKSKQELCRTIAKEVGLPVAVVEDLRGLEHRHTESEIREYVERIAVSTAYAGLSGSQIVNKLTGGKVPPKGTKAIVEQITE